MLKNKDFLLSDRMKHRKCGQLCANETPLKWCEAKDVWRGQGLHWTDVFTLHLQERGSPCCLLISLCLQGRWLLSVAQRSLLCVTGTVGAAGCHGSGRDVRLRAASPWPGDPVAAAETLSCSGAELPLAVLSGIEMSWPCPVLWWVGW